MPPLTDTDGTVPPAPPVSPSPPPMRASDADRCATVRVLQDAVARGLLAPDEGSERMAAAFGAVHVRDLGPLTADLPPAPAARSAPSAPGWQPLAIMAVEQVRSSLHGTEGRLSPARVAVVVLAAVLLLFTVGWLAGEVLFDGHGGRGFGPG
ncbi:DUF1707 domain-containing protein [Geodermatophilus sp. SYSU D00703]